MSLNAILDRAAASATVGTVRLATAGGDDLREQRLAWVWVLFAILLMVAAAVAFMMCVSKGYRGFAGSWRFHTKFKIPIGIDLACY